MWVFFLAACSGKKIIAPINKGFSSFYVGVAQKKEEKITPLERFAVRSSFHHMTAIGDVLFPESSVILKHLLYANHPLPENPNRSTKNRKHCMAQKKPQSSDTVIKLSSSYFRNAKKLNARIRKKNLGVHFDAFADGSVEDRVRYAYNPVCYEITKTPIGERKVRAYIWMKWSRSHRVKTPLTLGPFAVSFPDSLIHVAGPATPYYAVAEWELK
jgi:hypothetical protein